MTKPTEEFYQRAMLLGHDRDRLATEQEVVTYFTLPDIHSLREVMSVATTEERRKRQETFFNPPIVARSRLGQGLHDRGEAYVFADGKADESAESGLSAHMPVHVKSVSVLKKQIRAGETWDVSVRGEIWDLDDLEELYTTVNVGELTIEAGGRLVVQGNVFSLVCQKLVCEVSPEDGARCEIGVLPTPFPVDFKAGPPNGVDGRGGDDGEAGRPGQALQFDRGLMGFFPTAQSTKLPWLDCVGRLVNPAPREAGAGTGG